jgi:NADH dehydrogenase
MRIVLLGATGFVGHHLLPKLAGAGHDCLALSRYPMACRELSLIPRVRLQQTDVYDAERLAEAFQGADAVVNMVGILNESGRNGKGFHKAHVELTERVIDACRTAGVGRLVQISALNAGKGKSHYLISKGEAEERIRAATDIASTILQPSVIFGEGDSFFNRFAGLMKVAPVMPLACPDSRMQPVWVGDVAAAVAAVLPDPETAGKTLVLVGPRDYSLRELVEFTAHAAGLKRRIIGLPDGLSRLQGAVMDFVPGKPFSSDNYLSLQTDNTSSHNDLPGLGIKPRSIESVVPGYLAGSPHQHRLDKYRKRVSD